jgi:REP element-mobilizing transposase RayT
MPDHIHLLIQLGDVLSLGKCIARFKSKTVAALRLEGMAWQPGYFDHRLRSREDRRPYFIYIYLNPYRAGLLLAESVWPGFLCGVQDAQWFMPYLSNGLPEPEWLAGLP